MCGILFTQIISGTFCWALKAMKVTRETIYALYLMDIIKAIKYVKVADQITWQSKSCATIHGCTYDLAKPSYENWTAAYGNLFFL